MTDKEQIIIDGVDVSGCEFYVHYDYGKFPHGCTLHKDMFGLPVCCDVADCCINCYFKQLARKTAECEELKKKFSKFFNIDNQECWDIAFLKDENARYKQALDEIEEYIKNYDELDVFEDIKDIINKAKDGNNE